MGKTTPCECCQGNVWRKVCLYLMQMLQTLPKFPRFIKQVIINDILEYSQGDRYIESLLDLEEKKEFREKLEAAKDRWNELEYNS